MFFHNRTTPQTYGELVAWADDPSAKIALENGIGMSAGRGLHALEIQDRIWDFLVRCCHLLLHDLPSPAEGDIKPNPGPPAAEGGAVVSLEGLGMDAPYCIPAHLDLSRLEALISAERDAKEDHIWALREDPSYFADTMEEFAAHSHQSMLDSRYKEHPDVQEPGKPELWIITAARVVSGSYINFVLFDNILKSVKVLRATYARYSDAVNPEEPLPKELMVAFMNLRYALDEMVQKMVQPFGPIRSGLFSAPTMRKICYRDGEAPAQRIQGFVIGVDYGKEDHALQRLMPFLAMLIDSQKLRVLGLHALTDEIARLFEVDTEVKELITPYVARLFSTLSVLSECLHQLDLFQPWANKIAANVDNNRGALNAAMSADIAKFRAFMLTPLRFDGLVRLCDPTEGRFYYPVDRPRTEWNVSKLREAEANLDAFLNAVDDYYNSKSSVNFGTEQIRRFLSSERTIQRTPEWVEPAKTEEPVKQAEFVYQPWSTVFHDPTKEITGSFDRALSLTPGKKRRSSTITNPDPARQRPTPPRPRPTPPRQRAEEPQASPREERREEPRAEPGADRPGDQPPEAPADARPVFALDKRSLKVFRTLFYDPNNPDHPGELPWAEFLHAMVEVGFSAEKLHGSAWNFVPRVPGVGMEQPIQFHMPHGKNSTKMSFHVARRIGRRLGRTYGWVPDSFRAK
jgi:hypothetical protein